jgi:hypothetical protein
LSVLWDIYNAEFAPGADGLIHVPYEELTIRDIVRKLVKYGSVSGRALSFAQSLFARIGKRAEIEAQRAAEAEAAAPCPSRRVTVTGTVLSTKVQDSDWGTVIKMLVRDDAGFKVWCTVPGFAELNKGSRITFTVTLEPSNDDPKFGFGKRPTKLTVLAEAAQAVS